MPGLRELLRKKDKIGDNSADSTEPSGTTATNPSNAPEFKIIRSTTEVEEEVEPPTFDDVPPLPTSTTPKKSNNDKRVTLAFRHSANASLTKDPTAILESPTSSPQRDSKRLSSRLHLRSRSRGKSVDHTSENLPDDLPDAPEAVAPRPTTGSGNGGRKSNEAESEESAEALEAQEALAAQNEQREAAWEKRATLLVQGNPLAGTYAEDRNTELNSQQRRGSSSTRSGKRSGSVVSDRRGDDDIQEAIRLHELGELGLSTAMFGRLGDPKGQNNALAQVLFGLALRHGWGVPVEPDRAVFYLSLAAANSASVEQAALDAGVTKGGAAKGELVLAIFELANCFRHGWGVKVDRAAARQYYETAANLGDIDALEEAAWCLVEGFGGPKDKYKAAQYLRRAEEKGRQQVGNSWIWKDKYNPK